MSRMCPKCGQIMRLAIDYKNSDKMVVKTEKCPWCGYIALEDEVDHALDAVEYTLLYAKQLTELPPMVGVDATVREFSTRIDEEVQKAFFKGCISVNVEPDALKKTAELNSELQTTLKSVVEKIPKWIPVSERLPDVELKEYRKKYPKEECIEVIVAIKGATDTTTLYYDGEAFEDEYGRPFEVTHWMAMPELPEVLGG